MLEVNFENLKRCCICQTFKNKMDFSQNRRTKDNLQGFCKQCKNLKYPHKKVICICGKSVSEDYLNRHIERNLHRNIIAAKENYIKLQVSSILSN